MYCGYFILLRQKNFLRLDSSRSISEAAWRLLNVLIWIIPLLLCQLCQKKKFHSVDLKFYNCDKKQVFIFPIFHLLLDES